MAGPVQAEQVRIAPASGCREERSGSSSVGYTTVSRSGARVLRATWWNISSNNSGGSEAGEPAGELSTLWRPGGDFAGEKRSNQRVDAITRDLWIPAQERSQADPGVDVARGTLAPWHPGGVA